MYRKYADIRSKMQSQYGAVYYTREKIQTLTMPINKPV